MKKKKIKWKMSIKVARLGLKSPLSHLTSERLYKYTAEVYKNNPNKYKKIIYFFYFFLRQLNIF